VKESGALRDEEVEARRELGRLLADFRHRARLSQRQLARVIGYSASVVAAAETGRPHVSGDFWARSDDHLGAGRQLITRYEHVRYMNLWVRDQARHGEAAALPLTALPSGGPTLTTPAAGVCPYCHQVFQVVTQLADPTLAGQHPARDTERNDGKLMSAEQ
jgi:transcriptional regulator with XRE-family HTH domain